MLSKTINTTNHEISIYKFNCEDLSGDRYHPYAPLILENESISPILTYPKRVPLNSDKMMMQTFDYDGLLYSVLGISQLNPLIDAKKYDVIIVSKTYAENAKHYSGFNPDYIDRLYVTGRKILDKEGNTIGCLNLKKVLFFNSEYYARFIQSGGNPSITSVRLCLDYEKAYNMPSYFHPILENYLQIENQKRMYESAQPDYSTFQKIYNV